MRSDVSSGQKVEILENCPGLEDRARVWRLFTGMGNLGAGESLNEVRGGRGRS